MSVSPSLGNFGPLPTIEWNGAVLSVSLIDQNIKAMVEEELYRRYMKPVLDGAKKLPLELVSAKLDLAQEMMTRGEFGFMSERGRAFLDSQEGQVFLMSVLLKLPPMQVIMLILDKPHEVKALLNRVMAMSFPAVALKKETPENPPAGE